jgi:hypothetical protein
MVLLTAGAVLVGAVLTYFTVSAVATLAHWIAVAGGFVVMAGVAYQLVDQDLLADLFPTESLQVLSAGLIGSVTGFLSYRLLESVFAAFGFAGALVVAVLAVASIVYSPVLVANVLGGFIGAVAEALGDEQ